MPVRALIVAVEHYKNSNLTSQLLPGTIDNALKFADWIKQNFSITDNDLWFCSSANEGDIKRSFRKYAATKKGIKKAVLDLIDDGQNDNDTEKLFVYLAGHGVYVEGGKLETDVLLCSDFVDARQTGDECVQLIELTTILTKCLGHGTHFWFVDICRSPAEGLAPGNLAMPAEDATSGEAALLRLFSTAPGNVAANDSKFTDRLLECFQGDCALVADEDEPGISWVTFENLSRSVSQKLQQLGRQTFIEASGCRPETRLVKIRKPWSTLTIQPADTSRKPPVRLLVKHEDIVFFGETNGQLPVFVAEAFAERQKRPWKRLVILSIEDLTTAARGDTPLETLVKERDTAEQYFRDHADELTQELSLFRYSYVGFYGSFWIDAGGERRAHVAHKTIGEDIRRGQATDYIDFPDAQDPAVEKYFALASRVIGDPRISTLTFHHP